MGGLGTPNRIVAAGHAQRRAKIVAFMRDGGAIAVSEKFGPDLPLAAIPQDQLDYWLSPERSLDSQRSWRDLMEMRLVDERWGSRSFQTDLKMWRLLVELIDAREATEAAAVEAVLSAGSVVGVVYFIEAGGFVKIGFTTKLADRIGGIATGSPHPLTVLHQEAGTLADERAYHKRFAAFRAQREWFRLEGELAAFIAAKAEGKPK